MRNVDRIKALGGGIAVQSRLVMLGDDFVARYGPEKASASPPLRAILDRGVPLGVGTDATRGSTFNPWITLHWLITGQTASGLTLYPPDNRLDRLTALETHTVGSAWFSGEENTKGRIAPGQSADMILISDDYFAVTEEAIKSLESVLTVTAGRIVYAAAEFAPLNPPLDAVSPAWAPTAHFEPYWRQPR